MGQEYALELYCIAEDALTMMDIKGRSLFDRIFRRKKYRAREARRVYLEDV